MKTIKLNENVTALEVSKARNQSGTFSIISFKQTAAGVILKFMGELPHSLLSRAA